MPLIDFLTRPLGTQQQQANIAFSSDPIQGNPTPSFSAGVHRPTDRKRQRPLSSLSEHSPTPSTSHTETLVLRARDLLLEAVTCSKTRDEQARLLDLIEIFREYAEKGRIRHASTLLASQVANLEQATKRIENQARAKARDTIPAQPKTTTKPQTTKTTPKPTYATTAARDPEQWTKVSRDTKNKAKAREGRKD